MESHHDIEALRKIYFKAYETAMKEKNYKLPTYPEDWKATLNEIEFKFYSDIKSIGVLLYPYYPVENIVVDFANPFEKIAVVIQYKKSDIVKQEDKIKYLNQMGWTIYKMESKSVAYSAEELFNKTKNDKSLYLYELDRKTFVEFVNRNANINSECLLYSILEKHFK
jgi:very-short-patch-repair endonuclease